MMRVRSLSSAAGIIVGAVIIYLSGLALYLHVAHADIVGGPIPVATTSADAGWSLVQEYGPMWGGALLLLGLGRALLRSNESRHWIAQGRTLAVIAGALSVLAAFGEWHFNGGTPAGVLVTLIAAINLVWHPTVNPVPMFAVVVLALQPACGPRAVALEHAFWQCTAPERADAVAAVTPVIESLIVAAASADGKLIDVAPLKAATSKASLLTEAGLLLSCATASAFAALLVPTPATPGPTAAAPLVLDRDALRAAYEQLRPPGASFVTANGVL